MLIQLFCFQFIRLEKNLNWVLVIYKFAKEIIKNSKVKLFLVNDSKQLAKFIKSKHIWKKNSYRYGCRYYFKLDERITRIIKMKIDYLKEFIKEFNSNLKFNHDLKKKIGLI